jgi:hypothetical protein
MQSWTRRRIVLSQHPVKDGFAQIEERQHFLCDVIGTIIEGTQKGSCEQRTLGVRFSNGHLTAGTGAEEQSAPRGRWYGRKILESSRRHSVLERSGHRTKRRDRSLREATIKDYEPSLLRCGNAHDLSQVQCRNAGLGFDTFAAIPYEQMKMSAIIKRAMPNVIDQDIIYRPIFTRTLPNESPNRVPNASELDACWRWIVKQAQDQIRFEFQSARTRIEQISVKLRRGTTK